MIHTVRTVKEYLGGEMFAVARQLCNSSRGEHCNPHFGHFTLECVKQREIIREAMRLLARRRNLQLTSEQKKAIASNAAIAKWSKMTAEERSEQARERWRQIKARQHKANRARKSKS